MCQIPIQNSPPFSHTQKNSLKSSCPRVKGSNNNNRHKLHHHIFFSVVSLCASAVFINAHAASVSSTLDEQGGIDFEKLAREETWIEKRPNAAGQIEAVNVTAKIWTQAMQAMLDSKGSLFIPARQQPYYLDAPLVLRSGQKITAHKDAEIRLKPGCNTCLVRNAGIVSFRDRPVPSETNPDTDISIEGGIWTTLAVSKSESNGNARGHSSKENYAFGTHGVILLQNVRRVRVANVTVRQSRPFAVHLSNVQNFQVENIHLDDHLRDGVHVNGPASDGLIRNVDGVSHDDTVALNAWDWKNYAPSYGPIERVVIEDIRGGPAGIPSANAIRLLPGFKKFDDGTQLDCHLSDVTIRRIKDIEYFKIYDQPNLELGRQTDFSAGVGNVNNLQFESLVFTRPSRIELHANTKGISIRDVHLMHPTPLDWRLLFIGPKSQTYKTPNPDRWTEIFSPDLDCTVRDVFISGVRPSGSTTDMPVERVVAVVEQQLNLDYPRTTPKGGTGKGVWIR
jgi:hypothetical protein